MSIKRKSIFQLFVLLFMLVIFPALSWYYLKLGFDFRKNAHDEMGNYGKVNRSLISPSDTIDLYRKILVVGNKFEEGSQLDSFFAKAYQQFDDREDVYFLFLSKDSSNINTVQKKHWSYKILNDSIDINHFISEKKMNLLANEVFITDTTGIILNKYNLLVETDVQKMIRHIAVVLPAVEKKKLRFRKEIEK